MLQPQAISLWLIALMPRCYAQFRVARLKPA